MMAKRFTVLVGLTMLLSLSACKKSEQATSSASQAASRTTAASAASAKAITPIDFFGVDLRTVKRQKLEEIFFQTFQTPLIPRSEFESIADAGKIFPGAAKVDIAAAQSGALATMQFVFPGKGDPQLVAQVSKDMETRYGKPSAVLGKVEQGEYRALWEKGDDFIIQVARGWPDTTVYLSFISTKHLTQLREDMQKKLASPQNAKNAGQ